MFFRFKGPCSITRFSTLFYVTKTQPGPHMNRQNGLAKLFTKTTVCVRAVVDYADTMSAHGRQYIICGLANSLRDSCKACTYNVCQYLWTGKLVKRFL